MNGMNAGRIAVNDVDKLSLLLTTLFTWLIDRSVFAKELLYIIDTFNGTRRYERIYTLQADHLVIIWLLTVSSSTLITQFSFHRMRQEN